MKRKNDTVAVHTARAIKGLRKQAKPFEKAAAINAYVHLYLKRSHGAVGENAADVLKQGTAICGGMTMTLRAMLSHLKIENEYAFTVGIQAAHSMVEAYFADGSVCLLDPYHGALYFDKKTKKPIGLHEVYAKLTGKAKPVLYVNREFDITNPLTFKSVYVEALMTKPVDYDFPEIFSNTDASGVANSGFATFVNIELSPDTSVGNSEWKEASTAEPKPWSALSVWQKAPKVNLSWAYLMGRISMGYLIQHVYTLKNLEIGKRYTLEIKIANAFPINSEKDFKSPALTLNPVAPFGMSKCFKLVNSSFNSKNAYTPQIAKIQLIASTKQMSLQSFGFGEFVIQSISLKQD